MLFQTKFPTSWLSTSIIKFSAVNSVVSVAHPIMKHENPPCFSGYGRKLKRPQMGAILILM